MPPHRTPLDPSPARLRLLTADLPGIGGRIRSVPEDFLVEELPLYEPAGEGDHVHFLLEKHGISTFEALLWISKAVQVSEHLIGYAGLKDAKAVTRQWMSVHRIPPARLLAISHPRIRVLAAARHPTRLRIGHLHGNRFTIRIRGADPTHVPDARRALRCLAEAGVPNAYGVQRFGIKQDGHLLGRALVRGDFDAFLAHLLGRPSPREHDRRVHEARAAYDRGDLRSALDLFPRKHRVQRQALAALLRGGNAQAAFEALGKRARRIYVSAYQSWLFNRVLDRRLGEGTMGRLLKGDLAWQHATGALYRVHDEEEEAPRAAAFEASPTGPLPGYDDRTPEGAPGALEREVLQGEGLEDMSFRAPHVRTRGARRPLRVPLAEASLAQEGGGDVVARFVLPPGAFATVVLAELMKGRAVGGVEAEDQGEGPDLESPDPESPDPESPDPESPDPESEVEPEADLAE